MSVPPGVRGAEQDSEASAPTISPTRAQPSGRGIQPGSAQERSKDRLLATGSYAEAQAALSNARNQQSVAKTLEGKRRWAAESQKLSLIAARLKDEEEAAERARKKQEAAESAQGRRFEDERRRIRDVMDSRKERLERAKSDAQNLQMRYGLDDEQAADAFKKLAGNTSYGAVESPYLKSERDQEKAIEDEKRKAAEASTGKDEEAKSYAEKSESIADKIKNAVTTSTVESVKAPEDKPLDEKALIAARLRSFSDDDLRRAIPYLPVEIQKYAKSILKFRAPASAVPASTAFGGATDDEIGRLVESYKSRFGAEPDEEAMEKIRRRVTERVSAGG